jgi:hypothetical protein
MAPDSTDAVHQLVELAAERGDTNELRRLADSGNGGGPDVPLLKAGRSR